MKRLLQIPIFAMIICLLISAAPAWAQDVEDAVDEIAAESTTTTTEVSTAEDTTTPPSTMDDMLTDEMGEMGGAVAKGAGTTVIVMVVVYVLLILFSIIVGWRVFSKAGKPGIACIIPIWQTIVFCQIGGKPGWWLFLYCIPGVNIVIHVLVCLGIAHQFGKGAGFGLGLMFLPIIFFPILAFGSAQHEAVMQFPDEEQTGGAVGTATRPPPAPPKPKIITDATRYAVAAWIGIITLLMLLTIIAFQVYEMHYYSSDLPEHGTGSAWPAKIVPAEGATPEPAATPEAEPESEPAPGTNAPTSEVTN